MGGIAGRIGMGGDSDWGIEGGFYYYSPGRENCLPEFVIISNQHASDLR